MSEGPVTTATRIAQRQQPPALALALRAWPALPPLCLLRARPASLASVAGQVIGYDALLCLLACLAITPLLTVAPVRLGPLRRWYGIWVFTLGSAGLLIELATGSGTPADRITGTAITWSGTLIVVLLLPLAVTSHTISQKLLGPEWKRWQRWLTWAVWWVIAVHLLALRDWPTITAMLMCTLPLVLLRQRWLRMKVKAWRRDHYTSGGMWVAMDCCAAVLIGGLAWLTGLEALACARAFA